MDPGFEIELLKIKVDSLDATVRVLQKQIERSLPRHSVFGVEPTDATPPMVQLPNPAWRPVLHVRNTPQFNETIAPQACFQPAVYLTRMVYTHENADLSLLRVKPPGEHLWRQPQVNEVPCCSTCGRNIDVWSSTHLDYQPHSSTAAAPTPVSENTAYVHPRQNNAARRAGSAPHAEQEVRLTPSLRAALGDPPQAPKAEAEEPIRPDDSIVLPEDTFGAIGSGVSLEHPAAPEDTLTTLMQVAQSIDWERMGFPTPPKISGQPRE